MLRTIIQRQRVALVAPARMAVVQARQYTDRFSERENAYENKYIRDQEMKKVQALREQLEKAQKQVEEIASKIDEHHRDSSSKTDKK
ncbi:hypothetical protein GGI02_003770 [Coemansia sp. RSA 2322]|uniref:ATPase inhibitor, mitochondrial n=1 Tax=Coemansia thaxteri TaxID=2663907 RepID=A0A9W8EIU3_9FUNG|nr:hypothetical protein H4R26_003151 [Coemansia thaxteri]KAJ2468239.1 hypothetical protein GGI02_003770 [Coemansia sp. RSA 2322]